MSVLRTSRLIEDGAEINESLQAPKQLKKF